MADQPKPQRERDISNNPPGERKHPRQPDQPQGAGQPSPGLKDKDAPTSDTYGNTRESGESLKR